MILKPGSGTISSITPSVGEGVKPRDIGNKKHSVRVIPFLPACMSSAAVSFPGVWSAADWEGDWWNPLPQLAVSQSRTNTQYIHMESTQKDEHGDDNTDVGHRRRRWRSRLGVIKPRQTHLQSWGDPVVTAGGCSEGTVRWCVYRAWTTVRACKNLSVSLLFSFHYPSGFFCTKAEPSHLDAQGEVY